MALDGVTLAHLIREISPQLIGTRIDRVQQPEKDEIHLLLRAPGQNLRLLINTSANGSRLHFEKSGKKNPQSPPMFCMILRKHLEGGRIEAISQEGLERIITITIQNYNEYGDLTNYRLILEIMGKHSNLILVDPTGIILDGIKRYSHAVSRHREVLPGRGYLAPPSQGKLDPLKDEEEWVKQLLTQAFEKKAVDLLVTLFAGISPELAREIVIRAGLRIDIRLDECGDIDLSKMFQSYRGLADPLETKEINPCIYFEPGKTSSVPIAFSFVPFEHYHSYTQKEIPTINDVIQSFYHLKNQNNQLESQRGSLRKIIQDYRGHLGKKLNIYEETIKSSEKGLRYRLWGELLTANLYRLSPGMTEVIVEDYNEPDLPQITISLDPSLTGIENSQRYYRLYNKAKAAINKTEPLRTDVLNDFQYAESLLVTLEQSQTPEELNDVHKELMDQGIIGGKHSSKEKKEKRDKKSSRPIPREFRSSTGRTILVGKNNQQNDYLTLKFGKPNDLWMHVKQIPGSHVLIPLEEGEDFPDDATLEEGAALAIFFSQARGSTQVPVDYTHVKQIKKPNSSKPGMVIYDQNWTLYLTPKEEILERLFESQIETDSE